MRELNKGKISIQVVCQWEKKWLFDEMCKVN